MKWRNGDARGRGTLAVLVLLAIGVALGVGLFLFREKGRTAALVMAGTAAALQTVIALMALRMMERKRMRRIYHPRAPASRPPKVLVGIEGRLWRFRGADSRNRPPPQGVGGMKG